MAYRKASELPLDLGVIIDTLPELRKHADFLCVVRPTDNCRNPCLTYCRQWLRS